ncbi:hypothetical protein PsorP6_014543 [Peronosclerospora sorghi]|uniref:Uncharacterized protein n=1 Tax=Peronosclerospora sorghi TaxID=230839 RepID=A0ACC0VSN2_9STRA|nr:hypothetical protein PsorP6_014543 [Peronosclerospora sorghi]
MKKCVLALVELSRIVENICYAHTGRGAVDGRYTIGGYTRNVRHTSETISSDPTVGARTTTASSTMHWPTDNIRPEKDGVEKLINEKRFEMITTTTSVSCPDSRTKLRKTCEISKGSRRLIGEDDQADPAKVYPFYVAKQLDPQAIVQ